MSSTVDESSDATDTAQQSVFVRFFNREILKKELLCLVSLKKTVETMYTAVKGFFEKNSVGLRKISLFESGPYMIGRPIAEHPQSTYYTSTQHSLMNDTNS